MMLVSHPSLATALLKLQTPAAQVRSQTPAVQAGVEPCTLEQTLPTMPQFEAEVLRSTHVEPVQAQLMSVLCLPLHWFEFLQREQLVLQESFGGGFAAAGAAARVKMEFKEGESAWTDTAIENERDLGAEQQSCTHTCNTSVLTASTCHAHAATRVKARYLSYERRNNKKASAIEPTVDFKVPSASSTTTSPGRRMMRWFNLARRLVLANSTSSEDNGKAEKSL
jgi:hypothetical protein